MKDPILSRVFTVTSEEESKPDTFRVSIGRPFKTSELSSLGISAACKVEFGALDNLVEHELPGFDEFEALENALNFINFFINSFSIGQAVQISNGSQILHSVPSEFSVNLRNSFESVLEGMKRPKKK